LEKIAENTTQVLPVKFSKFSIKRSILDSVQYLNTYSIPYSPLNNFDPKQLEIRRCQMFY